MSMNVVSKDTFLLNQENTTTLLYGQNLNLTFIGGSNNKVIVAGQNNHVTMLDSPNATLCDVCQSISTSFSFFGAVGSDVVTNLAYDPTASINLFGQSPTYTGPDGHGGTLLGVAGGTIDFLGVGMLPYQLDLV